MKLAHRIGVAAGVLAFWALSAALPCQAQPRPAAFVQDFDVRCYRTPNQPAVSIPLRLDHLNPDFVHQGLPFENVVLQQLQDFCTPVYKNGKVPPADVAAYVQYADLACYEITGPPLNLPVHLDHLNPEIVAMFGHSENVFVKEPQQLCVPVYKDWASPPDDVALLISSLDLECYNIDPSVPVSGSIRLDHLNPLFADLPYETVHFVNLFPVQLCVPVMKNRQRPPAQVLPIVEYSDLLCYEIEGPGLFTPLTLTHLNPVLLDLGLSQENVFPQSDHKLCVPVAKDGFFPPA